MEELSFDKLRWKMAEELTTDEAQLIVDNKDKLNDEEKAAFADLLLQATPLPENPLEDAITSATEDNEDTKTAPQADASSITSPVSPPSPTPPLPENVITKERLDTYIEEKRKEWEAEGKTKAEQKIEAEKIQDYFEAGFQPKDWNDYTIQMVDKITPVIERKILNKLDEQNRKLQEEQQKMQKTRNEIFTRFEEEFSVLAKNKLIPDPKEKPDEYEKVHKAIIKIGDENGKTNITDAYKLWSIIPEQHGGGLKTNLAPQPTPEEREKRRIEAQKEAAGKIGSGRGAPASNKPGGPPSWATVHNNNMDTLLENRLKQA